MTNLQDGGSTPAGPKSEATVTKPKYRPFVTPKSQPQIPPSTPPPQLKEVRALWISRFDMGSPPVKRPRLEGLIHQAADAGFNVVLLQVRATGDAYYTPGIEPWSYRLTSARVADLGRNPGWDPLAVAIETAHEHGVELHAYLNAFTLWECSRGAPPHTTPEHPYWKLADYNASTKHYDPSWRVHAKINGEPKPMGDDKTSPVPCSEYVWASPGAERVHLQNLAVMKDLVARYSVDGIHLDRFRYPGRQFSHDPQTYTAWHAATTPVTLENWQRDNLSRWMAQYRSEIRAIRAQVALSAAVWFTYKKTAAMTFPTSQGYFDYYQDSHRWLAEGSVDAIAPMIYGPTFDEDLAKWKVLAEEQVRAQGERGVWLGLGGELPTFDLAAARIDYARKIGARGVAIWSAGGLDRRRYWDELKAGPFKEAAQAR